jgi:hypothetical protein
MICKGAPVPAPFHKRGRSFRLINPASDVGFFVFYKVLLAANFQAYNISNGMEVKVM